MVANRGVQPLDDTSANAAYFGANTKRGLELQKWVAHANSKDKDKGRTLALPTALSPIIWPCNVLPTGCVDKFLDGKLRHDKKRQTYNPSSPEPGKYQQAAGSVAQ